MIFNFLKKQESKEEIDTSAARDSVESLLDPDSFEYKYLKPFLKSDNLYYDDIEFYKDKPEFKKTIYYNYSYNLKKSELNLIRVFSFVIKIDFDFIDLNKIKDNSKDFFDIVINMNKELQKSIKSLASSKIVLDPMLKYADKENNYLCYEVAVYSDYDLHSGKCYLSEKYRLKYTKKEYRQQALIFAHEGNGARLIENGTGTLIFKVDGYAGEIGEIGFHDSKAILPYLDDDRYLIVAEIDRTIFSSDTAGAIVKVEIFDNPLNKRK